MAKRAKKYVTDLSDRKSLAASSNQALDESLVAALAAVERLYKESEPVEFGLLESFVDCRNHIIKALAIAREDLAQLRLPETRPENQPALGSAAYVAEKIRKQFGGKIEIGAEPAVAEMKNELWEKI